MRRISHGWWALGVNFLFVHASLDTGSRQAQVDSAAFAKLGIEESVGVLLYAKGGDAPDADYHVRMFAPEAGVLEDAATGSAAASLPGQIALSEALSDGEHRWLVSSKALKWDVQAAFMFALKRKAGWFAKFASVVMRRQCNQAR